MKWIAHFKNFESNPLSPGGTTHQAGTHEFTTPDEMQNGIGISQHPMGNPNAPGSTAYQDIEQRLIDGGSGSHAVVGIDRVNPRTGRPVGGHWFNAYNDNGTVRIVDGQSGRVSAWPPTDPRINNIDAAFKHADGTTFP